MLRCVYGSEPPGDQCGSIRPEACPVRQNSADALLGATLPFRLGTTVVEPPAIPFEGSICRRELAVSQVIPLILYVQWVSTRFYLSARTVHFEAKDCALSGFLDIPTLLIATAVAGLCICLSLFVIWRSERSETYVLHWSVSFGLATLAMLLAAVRGRLPGVVATTLPGALLLACFGILWLGYRRFAGRARRLDAAWAAAGIVLWLGFSLSGSAFADANMRELVNSSIELVYLLGIVRELLGDRRRYPQSAALMTIGLLSVHSAKMVLLMAVAGSGVLDAQMMVMPNTLFFGLSFIESAFFSVVLGLLQLVMIGQRSQQRFRIAAETDWLTGLANRRHFLDRLLPQLAAGGGALIIFDIDHFKRINDTFGHLAGDRALGEFSAILVAEAPAGSIAARIGGEEFALFLPKGAASAGAEIAERVRRRIASLSTPMPAGDLRLTVSCGVAGVAEAGSDYQALHGAADSALYHAKHSGRDRVVVHRSPVPAGSLETEGATDHGACPLPALEPVPVLSKP